ncbi:hypothetical protein WMC37_01860 [Leuconostoc mesenteroides subsp. mesenteroides]
MIPDNVMINYYWVGFENSNTSTIASAGNYIGLNASDDGKGSLQEGSTKKYLHWLQGIETSVN